MELLGHSQMRTTMDIYSHVMPALAREAADRMGTVLLMRPASTATRDDSGRPLKENGLVIGPADVRPRPFPHVKREGRRQRTAADNRERRRLATRVAPPATAAWLLDLSDPAARSCPDRA